MIEPPIVVIYANPMPRHSRINRPLAAALAALPGVQMRDLYARYTDYDIDVVAEQRALSTANAVVLQFPLRWYSVPPLLKLWIDEVLESGWAFGPGGTALRGKSLMVLASAGGSADAYSEQGSHGYDIERFLLPLEQTARLCGMDWLPPLMLLDANHADAATLEEHIVRVSACLTGAACLPNGEVAHGSA